jgi:four helix bundle protein
METRNSKLEVVNDVRLLIQKIYLLKYPSSEIYGLQSQIRRAAVSVCLNLVEGNAFYDGSKLVHFRRAFGSIQEVEECFILTRILDLIPCDNKNETVIMELLDKCSKKIRRLIQSVAPVSSFEIRGSS